MSFHRKKEGTGSTTPKRRWKAAPHKKGQGEDQHHKAFFSTKKGVQKNTDLKRMLAYACPNLSYQLQK